jgi:hypothetical protein
LGRNLLNRVGNLPFLTYQLSKLDPKIKIKIMFFNSKPSSTETKTELTYNEADNAEKQIASAIKRLENEANAKRVEMKQTGISAELFREINGKVAEIKELKLKLFQEQEMKRRVFRQYQDRMTETDFQRLWNQSLRDSTIVAEIEGRKNEVASAAKHPIYAKW